MEILRIHLKQTRWLWIGFYFVSLIFLIYFPIYHDYTAFQEAPTTTSRAERFFAVYIEKGLSEYKSNNDRQLDIGTRNRYVAQYQALDDALKRHDYQKVNHYFLLVSQHGRQDSWGTILTLLAFFQRGNPATVPLYYFTKHKLNVTPMVSPHSDAVNTVAGSLGANGFAKDEPYIGNPMPILLISTGAMCLLFGDLFTADYRRGTANFLRTQPQSFFSFQLQRGCFLVGIMSLTSFLALAFALMLVAVTPDHNFGDLRYPLAFLIGGKTLIVPIWLYLLRWWLLVTLWVALIAGLAFLLSLFFHDQLLCTFLVAVIVFARQLNLLKMVPLYLEKLLPIRFSLMPQLFFQADEFAFDTTIGWAVLFLVWIVLLWSMAYLVTRQINRPHRLLKFTRTTSN